jgi:hypothetical protein
MTDPTISDERLAVIEEALLLAEREGALLPTETQQIIAALEAALDEVARLREALGRIRDWLPGSHPDQEDIATAALAGEKMK